MPTKPATRSRGRPALKPTAAQRRQVSIAAAGGMRHEDIAIAIGVCRDTLTKHFDAELSAGAAMRRMEVLQALYVAAKKGSSSAARAFLAADPTLGVPAPPEAPKEKTPAAQPAQALGKKDKANADAVTAADGTEWADLLKPAARGVPLQ